MGIMSLNERQDCLVINAYSKSNKELLANIEVMMTNSLCIDGLPAIKDPYNLSGGLPDAKGFQAHMDFLTMDNNKISIGKETLLEWHYSFGPRRLQKVQFYFASFPF